MAKAVEILGVVANYFSAKVATRSSVKRLVKALGSDDEDSRTAAYMGLVKLGPSIAPVLLEEARKGHQTPAIIQILGDHGDPGIIDDVKTFLGSSDAKVVSAAHESLALLGQQQGAD